MLWLSAVLTFCTFSLCPEFSSWLVDAETVPGEMPYRSGVRIGAFVAEIPDDVAVFLMGVLLQKIGLRVKKIHKDNRIWEYIIWHISITKRYAYLITQNALEISNASCLHFHFLLVQFHYFLFGLWYYLRRHWCF